MIRIYEEKIVSQFCCRDEVTYSCLVKKVHPVVIKNALISTEPLIALKVSDTPSLYHAGKLAANRIEGGNIRENDVFKLTDYGKDVLYQLRKERCQKMLNILAALGGIAAIIQLILYLWPLQ